MRDEEYVFGMLQRAELKKRKALKVANDTNYLIQSTLIRQLKIILEIKNNNCGRGKIKKVMSFNDSLI